MSHAIKKKIAAASADQFEDAEEDDSEDFSFTAASSSPKMAKPTGGAESVHSNVNVLAVESDTRAKPIMAETTGNKQDTAATYATIMDDSRPDPPCTLKPLPPLPTVTSTASPTTATKNRENPLDALAFACAAEENTRHSTKPLPKPVPTMVRTFHVMIPTKIAEGTRVAADEISCTDVLCGRGGQSNHHPGNIFFRRLVRAKQEEYLKANKREKTVVAKDIVKLIRMLTPPGRFLKKDPKDENVYVDVGDIQARNKASQALREGAPELREELRDQHTRLGGNGQEVKLPYHGNRSTSATSAEMSAEGSDEDHPTASPGQRMVLPTFVCADGRPVVGGLAKRDPDAVGGPEDDEAAMEESQVAAAAAYRSAEERARRIMMTTGPPAFGAHLLNPNFGGYGMGPGASMNPFLAASPAAQLQAAAAMQAAAAGGHHHHMLSHQLMLAAAAQHHHHHQPSTAALLHASRAREYAQYEAANMAAAAGINPMLLGGQQQRPPQGFHDPVRLRELVDAGGNTNKRERGDLEREIDEKYAKAAKLSRQYL